MVKVIPDASASGSQANGHKRLKVICGSNISYLADLDWIGDKTPMIICDVRVSPSNSVKPNVGASELADALNRVLPFIAKDDNRPILQCVNLIAKEGKLTLVSADGYQLVVMPMLTTESSEQAKKDREAKAEPITEVKTEPEASEPVAETVGQEQAEPAKPKKARRSRAKEPVTV